MTDVAIKDIPILQYLKPPVFLLADLYTRYPDGGQFGWFALVNKAKKFAYWNIEAKEWQFINEGETVIINEEIQTIFETLDTITPYFVHDDEEDKSRVIPYLRKEDQQPAENAFWTAGYGFGNKQYFFADTYGYFKATPGSNESTNTFRWQQGYVKVSTGDQRATMELFTDEQGGMQVKSAGQIVMQTSNDATRFYRKGNPVFAAYKDSVQLHSYLQTQAKSQLSFISGEQTSGTAYTQILAGGRNLLSGGVGYTRLDLNNGTGVTKVLQATTTTIWADNMQVRVGNLPTAAQDVKGAITELKQTMTAHGW
ncbi:MAG: hypothetical protein LBN27_05090 [Prevotellaceae bacterium]|jgi:hypothetical protein|nr:hypothetical protein [Prevotellaceae bacterium]